MTGSLPDSVWWPMKPGRDESLLGFCVRSFDDNELPHLQSLLADAGQRHRNRHVDVLRGEADPAAIAAALGVGVAEVESRRGRCTGGRLLYRGVEMQAADLCATVRRFAPGTLAVRAVHRAEWCLRTLPVCFNSLEVLQAHCACGARQGWTMVRKADACERCGYPLADTPPIRPTEADLPALRNYADLFSIDPDARAASLNRLPRGLAHLSAGDVAELALQLAPFLVTGLGDDVRRQTAWFDRAETFTSALASAWRHLEGWPNSLSVQLLGLVDLQSAEPRMFPLKRLAAFLRGTDRSIPDAVRAEIMLVGKQLASPGIRDETAIDYLEAEAMLGRNRATLRTARRNGELSTRMIMRRGEIFPALDRNEIQVLAATTSLGASIVGRELCLPRYAVEQLAAASILKPIEHPFIVSIQGLKIEQASIDLLIATIEGLAIPDPSAKIPLIVCLRSIGGGELPFADAYALLLAGTAALRSGPSR